jgi:hypothetical protein
MFARSLDCKMKFRCKGAGRALPNLANLVPSTSLTKRSMGRGNGRIEDIPVSGWVGMNQILIRPGESPLMVKLSTGNLASASFFIERIAQWLKPMMKVVAGQSMERCFDYQSYSHWRWNNSKPNYATGLKQVSKSQYQNRSPDRLAGWLLIQRSPFLRWRSGVWLSVGKWRFNFAINRAVTVLVITCPRNARFSDSLGHY